MIDRRQRTYEQEGRSDEYRRLKKLFLQKKKQSIGKLKEKLLSEVKSGSKANIYKTLQNLGTEKSEHEELYIPDIDDSNLSPI